eukprot:TRINITY_DN4050_c0_g1_i1.p1 TRINITY_DN4050_c0_g1~~TRINITY_DN4050_c0_g1_i1.p1  ORF type:complete len:469 (-),score=107.41 TRINITY_DN4050_c0_g1_i1:97-1503(-)
MSFTVKVKHLPPTLSNDALKQLFTHYGAIDVRPCEDQMKGTSFVDFTEEANANKLISIFNHLHFMDKVLSAEYAPKQSESSKSKSTNPKPNPLQVEPISSEVNYPPPPLLEYSYPQHSPTILNNIITTLMSAPKFYTQVLHLMNKMNLPPPFGPSIPTPETTKRKHDELLSGSESELESDEEKPPKKKITKTQDVNKMLSKDSGTSAVSQTPSSFSQAQTPMASIQKTQPQKIKIVMQNQHLPSPPPSPPQPSSTPVILPITSTPTTGSKVTSSTTSTTTTTGGPPSSTPQMANSNPYGGAYGSHQFPPNIGHNMNMGMNMNMMLPQQMSSYGYVPSYPSTAPMVPMPPQRMMLSVEELFSKKASAEELAETPAFKNYEVGDPFPKIYIKNIDKSVTVDDLKYLFAHLFESDEAVEKGLEIKLMTMGKMKGQAFVTFPTTEMASTAVQQLHGFKLYNKPLIIQFGKQK